MSLRTFRPNPDQTIVAVPWRGDNLDEVTSFMIELQRQHKIDPSVVGYGDGNLTIQTATGELTLKRGEGWVAYNGVDVYPIPNQVFEQKYVEADGGVAGEADRDPATLDDGEPGDPGKVMPSHSAEQDREQLGEVQHTPEPDGEPKELGAG